MVATLTSVMIDAAAMASTDTDAVPLDDRIAPTPSQPIEQEIGQSIDNARFPSLGFEVARAPA